MHTSTVSDSRYDVFHSVIQNSNYALTLQIFLILYVLKHDA